MDEAEVEIEGGRLVIRLDLLGVMAKVFVKTTSLDVAERKEEQRKQIRKPFRKVGWSNLLGGTLKNVVRNMQGTHSLSDITEHIRLRAAEKGVRVPYKKIYPRVYQAAVRLRGVKHEAQKSNSDTA